MKRILLASLTALVLGTSAFAQGVGVQVGPVGAGITFAPEQRTHVRDDVVRERLAPVTVRERIRVGATLPADIELRTVPADWGPAVVKYRYVYYDNHVFFVEPSTRKVIYELD